MSRLDCRQGGGALPLPLAGEGWGRGLFPHWDSPRGESPHPRLRRGLSRKRERLKSPRRAAHHHRIRPLARIKLP
ncbi:hypothetical protein XH83_33645 [Bradyrhizobium sp. CCBAU 53351]|nr:hypothetical protein XH83_33645 [Bradyrhizobium sp. CCBAU 53351]